MTEYLPPAGPRWMKNAFRGAPQTDGRGVKWEVFKVEAGGRTLHWRTADGRTATTTIVATHPDYPSDDAVLQWQREQARNNHDPYSWY